MKKLFFALVPIVVLSFLLFLPDIFEKDVISKFPGFVPADDWFEKQRAYPFDDIPNEERLKAIDYVKKNFSPENVPSKYRSLQWEFSGPINIEGRVTTIAVHPVNSDIVYIGTANGGLFKTTDFFQSYQSIFDDQNTTSIGDVALDPLNPDIIYCGTGESNSLRSYYPGTGIYKSTDAGMTWTFSGLPESHSIGRIAINPLNPQEVYAAALGSLRKKNEMRGLYKTTDGGTTWNNVLFIGDSVSVVDVVVDPVNPQRVFAAAWERLRREDFIKYGGPKSALYYSSNGGSSWNIITNGFPSLSADLGRISMDICRTDPQVMYTLISLTDGSSGGLYKSINGGANWSHINPYASGSLNYAWFNRVCRVNPANSNIVYCGGFHMSKSTNGGSSFSEIFGPHVDHHAVDFSRTYPDVVVIGNDGGIDYTVNGGLYWQESNSLPVTQFYAGEIHPQNPDIILGGTQDNGTVRTLTGNLNDWDDIFGGDGFYCLIDYVNPNRMYASSQYGVLGYSTNGGNNFNPGSSGLDNTYTNWMTPYVMDKNNPMILYCGTYKIHKTTNGMQSWTAISPDLAKGHLVNLGTITTVDVSRSDPSVIYCGTDDANVWVTTNGGTNWNLINNNLPNRWVTRVTIHPDSANICYVSLSGYKIDATGAHIFRTTDFGTTWQPINGNLPDAPINDIIIDPLDYNSLYIATDNGVFFTTNLGITWYILGDGIPGQVPCHDLTLHPSSRKMVVWTHGKGSFSIVLPNPPLPVELTHFNLVSVNGIVELTWQTASELNNRGFIIQRGNDKNSFYDIGFISGKGNAVSISSYSFTDKNLSAGKHYYRLKQVDYNGSYTYSEVLEVENPGEFSLAQNFPNPFNPVTNISYTLSQQASVSLTVYNLKGEEVIVLINEEKPAGEYETTWDASSYPSGVYFVRMQAGQFSEYRKILLMK